MRIKVGEKIPSTDFFYLDEGGAVKKIKSNDLFAKEKAILIGVPGAFTKVCKIICISVNDPNVMKAWGEIQKVENKIFMAADPYCEFTKALGAEIDRTERGLGMRSERYTMMVDDNTVKIIKVEEDTAQCEISAAENFIEAI